VTVRIMQNIDVNVIVYLCYAMLIYFSGLMISEYLLYVFILYMFFYLFNGFQTVSCKEDRLALEQEVHGLPFSSYQCGLKV